MILIGAFMRDLKLLLLVLLLLFSSGAFASDRKKPPTAEELAAITQRGRALYEYDEVAWHGSDAVQATKPDSSKLSRFLAYKADDGWHLGFGKLSGDGSKFLLAYEAVQPTGAKEFKVSAFNPVREETGFYATAARAVSLTQKVLTMPVERTYNYAVLPALDNQWFVYWLPAQTDLKVFPLGGDTRYLVSSDGTQILETRKMHNSILETAAVPEGTTAAGGYHTAVLDDVPEDSDVFHVLTRRPSVPEYIASRKYFYEVETDGSIKYLGETKKVLKSKGAE
jgi:hypothetical protein